MARRKFPLPTILNVSSGATAILDNPVGGLTYEQIHLELTNISDAQITNIKVKMNGENIQEYEDGAFLRAMNGYKGRPNTAGVLSFYFAQPEMADIVRERVTGIGTLDLQSFTIEFDLATGLTNPSVKAYAMVSEPRKMGAFIRLRKFPFNFGSSGEVEMTGITQGAAVLAMHFQKNDVSNVKISESSKAIVDMPKTVLQHMQKSYGRVPDANYTHVDFILEGDPSQALITSELDGGGVLRAKDLRFLPTLDTSGQVDLFVEYYDSLS